MASLFHKYAGQPVCDTIDIINSCIYSIVQMGGANSDLCRHRRQRYFEENVNEIPRQKICILNGVNFLCVLKYTKQKQCSVSRIKS